MLTGKGVAIVEMPLPSFNLPLPHSHTTGAYFHQPCQKLRCLSTEPHNSSGIPAPPQLFFKDGASSLTNPPHQHVSQCKRVDIEKQPLYVENAVA